MKKADLKTILREVKSVERGETAPARVRDVTLLPGGKLRRVELNPETYRRKQARAWKAKTESARVRHELDLTQNAFANLLGASLATVRMWERGTGDTITAAENLPSAARSFPAGLAPATPTPNRISTQ